jgi:hypothetical protein
MLNVYFFLRFCFRCLWRIIVGFRQVFLSVGTVGLVMLGAWQVAAEAHRSVELWIPGANPWSNNPEVWWGAGAVLLGISVTVVVRAVWRKTDSPTSGIWTILDLGLFALVVAGLLLTLRASEWGTVGWRVANRIVPTPNEIAWLLVPGEPRIIATVPPIIWPLRGHPRVSSAFGMRHHPVFRERRFHNGIDLTAPIGTPVQAATDGRVLRASEDDKNGRYVVLMSPKTVRTAYCHLDEIKVSKGEHVQAGQIIGLTGNTGRSTGPHLHFGVWVDRTLVDPQSLVVNRRVASAN